MEAQNLTDAKVFNADTAHTTIGFAVKHMMFSKVRGQFTDFKANVEMPDNNFENAKLNLTADVQSISTNNEDRDKHLRSADFFNAEQNGGLTFESVKITKNGEDYTVEGNLTMNGVTNPVTLDTEFSGVMKDPWGNDRIGMIMKGKINREDWNMTYNAALEAGGVLVGKQVELEIESQFV